jgi:hypothetical protein
LFQHLNAIGFDDYGTIKWCQVPDDELEEGNEEEAPPVVEEEQEEESTNSNLPYVASHPSDHQS